MIAVVCTSCQNRLDLDETKLPSGEVTFPCPVCKAGINIDGRLVPVVPGAGPRLVACRCCEGRVSDQAAACPHCGQPDPGVTDWIGKAKRAVADGKMIDAIKIVRQYGRLDLKDAKDLIASWSS